MISYIIEGGKKLEGELDVSGSKNASLPIIAASILSGKTTKLYNVPNIHDTQITLKILEILGCKIYRRNGKIVILGRFKKATFSYPGGCDIGSRPIDLHLNGLRKLGINIEEEAGYINCKCNQIVGSKIQLDFPSVGATENIIMAATLAEGETVITNAAMEPEIVDLQNFLNRMGAKIEGAGTNIITIQGVKKIK